MSRGVNKWIGIGNCCADPMVRYTPAGAAVTSVTIACNDSYKDKQTGEKVDKAEFIRIVFFGKLAEIAGEYLKKGAQIYVEGKFTTRKWVDKETNKDRYSSEIVVDGFNGQLQMLGGRDDNQAPAQRQNKPDPNQSQFRNPPAPAEKGADWEDDSDIPF